MPSFSIATTLLFEVCKRQTNQQTNTNDYNNPPAYTAARVKALVAMAIATKSQLYLFAHVGELDALIGKRLIIDNVPVENIELVVGHGILWEGMTLYSSLNT